MSVENITIESKEIVKVVKFVKSLSKTMVFDSEIESRDWVKGRKRNNFLYSLLPAQKGVKQEKIKIGETKVLKSTCENPDDENVILYIHGGGFVSGSAIANKSFSSTLAKQSGYRVFAPDYSLSPENKFPKGFEDCCEVFDWIVENYPQAKISLIGESAGGNLSLAVALKYKDTGKVRSVSVHSPTVDFSGSVDRSINEKKDFIVLPGSTEPLLRMYVGDGDAKNPFVSPILGDYSNFPPVFITCDENETLYADSLTLYKKCEEANVKVHMIVASGAFHAFGISGNSAPETAEVLKKNIEFMQQA